MNVKLIGIEIVFAIGLAMLAMRIDVLATQPTWVLAMLAFAVLRAVRSLSYNQIFEWLRAPFTHLVDDTSGAGENVEANAGSAIGSLLACPICTGTWSALGLAILLAYLPALGRATVLVLGSAGVMECLHWWAEREEWQGRAAREQAGTEWLRKNALPFKIASTRPVEVERNN